MRIFGYLVLVVAAIFVAWPYYHILRLDTALGHDDAGTLTQLVDVGEIRRNYRERLQGGLGLTPQTQDPGSALAWLQQNLHRLGDAALEQAITLEWARNSLKEAAAAASREQPPYFIAAISFAFFESYDRFLIRLGELGRNSTHVRMRLQSGTWRVTDIIR